MIRKFIAVALLVLLHGCYSEGMREMQTTAVTAPTDNLLGEFSLPGNDVSMDEFLAKMRPRIPAAFGKRGFKGAVMSFKPGEPWAKLSFSESYRDWELGLQFYRYPDERGNRIVAVIRTAGQQQGKGTYFLHLLDSITARIYQALQDAQAAE